ncbi:MAG: DUF6714 family protein [Pseudomonadota bacterium]
MTREQLDARITDVFSGLSRPDDTHLLQYQSNELWVTSFLGGNESQWSDIDETSIAYENAALTCLTPACYAYYLAAYLRWCVRHHDTSDSVTFENTLYHLNSCGYGGDTQREVEANYRALTTAQSETVLHFLTFMARETECPLDREAAQQAIACYWYRFGGDGVGAPPR